MLSEQSRQNLIELFQRAARSSLLRSAEHSWAMDRDAVGAPATSGTGPLLVITTATFQFRLLTIFSVPDSEANRGYFVPPGSGLSIHDGFAEAANLCCGALNREISNIYTHLAMSVPSCIRAQCLDYLAELAPEFIAGFTISINNTARIGVTLCLCCTAPVDFPMQVARAEQATGELELF
jgi:hypothetical protein